MNKREEGILPITDPTMTRFNISLQGGVDMVLHALDTAWGGELYVPKIPSYKILDVAQAIAPSCEYKVVGIRPGEKIHEQMIGIEDSYTTFEYKNYFKILPQINSWALDKERIKKGKKVKEGFIYASDNNKKWMTKKELKAWITSNYDNF